jgi:hypothetical protein
MKVCGTSTSQTSSGERQDESATPRPDRLRRGQGAGSPATRPTAGGIPRDTQPGPDTSVDGAGAPRSHGWHAERPKEDLEGEPETHGRIGCSGAGNSAGALRTRRWSKALKSATLRRTRRARCLSNERRIGRGSRVPAQHHLGGAGRRSGSPPPGADQASPEARECHASRDLRIVIACKVASGQPERGRLRAERMRGRWRASRLGGERHRGSGGLRRGEQVE